MDFHFTNLLNLLATGLLTDLLSALLAALGVPLLRRLLDRRRSRDDE